MVFKSFNMKQFIRFLLFPTFALCFLAIPKQGIGMSMLNPENSTDLFERYFWLNRKIDIADCENTKVTEYIVDENKVFANYVYIITGETATLYNAWGFDVCEDTTEGPCLTDYNLTTKGSEWSCGEAACSIFEICPNEEAYYRLDRYFYRNGLGPNCERDCDEVTKVDIFPADFATLDRLTGIRFNPPTTTTYTITYTIGKDGGPIGGDCNDTNVPCTVQTRTRQVCVIVKDCGRCDAPVVATDLLNNIGEGWLDTYSGVVLVEHFGPETGYFYELKNKCPYYGSTLNEDRNFNGYFYSCSADLICFYGERVWGLGNVPYCSSNPYQLDLSKATSSKIVYETACAFQPVTYNICAGESIILGYNTNGAAPDETGKPTNYDCSQPVVTIEQIGNPIQVENGFRVTPSTTTSYNIEVQHPNGTCPPRSYQYLVQVDDNCEEVLTADNLPNRFPWLEDVVDFDNCAATTIEVYQQSVFNYILITTPETTTLYFQDGTFYCQNATNLDCKTAYKLVTPIVTWTCKEGNLTPNSSATLRFNNPQQNTQFSIYPNPSNGRINLNLPVSTANNSTIRIYTALGKLVKVEKISAGNSIPNLEMDLTTYEKGIYFLTYTAGEVKIAKKIVLK